MDPPFEAPQNKPSQSVMLQLEIATSEMQKSVEADWDLAFQLAVKRC
jgi:hypothetical protein